MVGNQCNMTPATIQDGWKSATLNVNCCLL